MHHDLLLVVQIWISLIGIQAVLTLLRDPPQNAMYFASRLPRYGFQSVSGSVAAKKEFMVLKDSGTHHMGIRAKPRHLF